MGENLQVLSLQMSAGFSPVLCVGAVTVLLVCPLVCSQPHERTCPFAGPGSNACEARVAACLCVLQGSKE